MKIVQIHNYYRFDGGEEIMLDAITRMLRQKGHKVYIFEGYSMSKDYGEKYVLSRDLSIRVPQRRSSQPFLCQNIRTLFMCTICIH